MDVSIFDRFQDLKALGKAEREALLERMRRVEFRKGETLVRILEPVQRVFLILDGLAGLETVSVNGIRRIVWVFRPGELIGSRTFLEQSADDSEVKTLTAGEAAVIAGSELERLARVHPEIGLALTRILTERLQGMTRRLLAATTLDVEVRLARLLLEFADGDGASGENGKDGFRPLSYPITHETMAEIVGASRPHISATLGDLEERGGVRRGRGGKLAIHPEALARLMESAGLSRDGTGEA